MLKNFFTLTFLFQCVIIISSHKSNDQKNRNTLNYVTDSTGKRVSYTTQITIS